MQTTIFTTQTSDADVPLGASDSPATRVLYLSGGFGGGTFSLLSPCPQTGTLLTFDNLTFTEAGAYPVIIPRGVPVVARLAGATAATLTATFGGKGVS